mmetsp:Transcript_5644/g.8936  ORF Transcript_5644/g.8936 Transcript_5644/m.8936 type:complete len:674 (-) Transcript_5644:265-2286(-)
MKAALLLLQQQRCFSASLASSSRGVRALSCALKDLAVIQSYSEQRQIRYKNTQASPKTFPANQWKQQIAFKSTTAGDERAISGEPKNDNTNTTSGPAKPAATKWDLGVSTLIPEWKRMFSPDTVFTDISAGITVGCIAVPLSLAIALASGVPAEVGLVTAAVSGVAGGLMGGTTLAVTGPAAAISLLIISAVEQHGLEALPIITLGCGALQVASGISNLGVACKLVPASVIAGFTTGVGTMILSGQLPKALGMAVPAGLNPVEVVSFVGQHISQINPSAAALAFGTSAAMFYLPKLHPKMPSALLAVGGATVATHTLGLDVTLLGNIPSGLEAFKFGLPSTLPSGDSLPSLAATTLLIYAMTSAESLLSCAALEKMKKTPYKYNPDQELVGQGLANLTSGMFLGMPVTSVIARSSLNARLGASTRLPALVQAGFVFGSVALFSQSIAMIPMSALSGVLITTGVGMLNPTEFKHCYAVQKKDALPFAATLGGMLAMGLPEGIGIGCVSAVALHYSDKLNLEVFRLSKLQYETSKIPAKEVHFDTSQNVDADTIPNQLPLYQLNGPINFISMFQIDKLVKEIEVNIEKQEAELGRVDPIVVDFDGVTTVEFTGVEELVNRLVEVGDHGKYPIQIIHCNDEEVRNAMDQCDPTHKLVRFSKTHPEEIEIHSENNPF